MLAATRPRIDLTMRVTSSVEGYHNVSAASNALTLQWPASTFPTMATRGTKFSECINTSVACIYFSNSGNTQREILKSSNGMKNFDLQAFELHGSRCMQTHLSGVDIATLDPDFCLAWTKLLLDPETASASA